MRWHPLNMKYMRNILHSIALATLLMGTGAMTTACFGDEDNNLTLSDESAVTQATLGTLKRLIHTRTRDGKNDSTYTVSISGLLYPLTIDHAQGRIYNADSLPYGTQVKRVALAQFLQTGTAVIRSLHTQKDTAFVLTDSTDYSQPRQLTIQSWNGKNKRSYTLELRVHQQEGDSTHWQTMSQEQWAQQKYVAPISGQFKSSTFQWKVGEGKILRSTDGTNWTAEVINATEVAQLPTSDIVGASRLSRTSPQLEDLLLYGTKEDKSRVWKGTIDLTGAYALGWMYLPVTEENTLPAPSLKQPHLLAFDDGFLLVGLNEQRQTVLRYSIDRGRTWKAHPSLRLPAIGAKSVSRLEVLVDAQQHLWLRINENEVWRGHINRLLWTPQPHIFLKARQK